MGARSVRVGLIAATALTLTAVAAAPATPVAGADAPPTPAPAAAATGDAWFGPVAHAAPEPGPTMSYGSGGLQPLVPARLLDTRTGIGAPPGRVGPDGVVELTVAGRGGVPAVGAGAVVLNVTAVAATAGSFVTVWPTGAARPTASNLNVAPGETVPNLVVVKVGAGGRVSLFNRFGSVDLVADVAGWFPEGAGIEPLVPARILDTRDGTGAPRQRVGADGQVDLQITGRGGVPETGVGAVVMNLTAVAPTERSFVTAWPTGSARPTASNLNLVPGGTVPNLVVVKVGAGGKVSLFNRFGAVDLIADVAGWFPDNGGFVPLVPDRILDTRTGNGAAAGAVGADGSVDLQVAGRGGVPADGAGAVVLNVTAVGATAGSFVTVWPTGVERPTASNLNPAAGATVPNLVIVKLGDGGMVSLFNRFGSVDLVADVAGWFPDGTASTTTLVPAATTTMGGPGDVVAVTGTSDTGATVVLSATADVPVSGGHLAIFPHAAAPGGVSGRVTSVTPHPDGTATVVLEPASVQDMFADLDAHGGFEVDLDALAESGNSLGLRTQASLGSWDCGGSVTLSSLPSFTLGGLDATFDYDLSDRYARVLLTMEPSVGWQLKESIALSCKLQLWEDKTLGWIGPFEISGGGASLSVSASAGAKSADMGGSMPIKLGFEHKDGDTTDLSGIDVVASGSNASSASASASVGLSFSTKGKAFGIAGLSLSAGPKLTATLTAPTCVTIGLSAAIGLSGEIGKWMLTWKIDLGSFTIDLGEIYRNGCDEGGPSRWLGTLTADTTIYEERIVELWGNTYVTTGSEHVEADTGGYEDPGEAHMTGQTSTVKHGECYTDNWWSGWSSAIDTRSRFAILFEPEVYDPAAEGLVAHELGPMFYRQGDDDYGTGTTTYYGCDPGPPVVWTNNVWPRVWACEQPYAIDYDPATPLTGIMAPRTIQAIDLTIVCDHVVTADDYNMHLVTTLTVKAKRSPCDTSIDSDADGMSDCAEFDNGTDPMTPG